MAVPVARPVARSRAGGPETAGVAAGSSNPSARPIFAPELAARLGYSTDYFRRHIDRLIIEQRMPLPLPALGWKRWDRAAVEAWLAGMRPPRAANDSAMLGDDVAGERARLAQVYGRAG